MDGARILELAPKRSWTVRLREGCAGWWRRGLNELNVGVWSTDTLPLIRHSSARTCLTVHDLRFLYGTRYLTLKRFLLLKLMMVPALRRADAVVTVSRWSAAEMARRFDLPSSRLHVVPNAVDPRMRDQANGAASPFGADYILAVGHLESRKNLPVLVEAFAGLRPDECRLLVLAGSDLGMGESLRRQSEELGIGNRVVITGAVAEVDLPGLYSNSRVLVCPSLYEGFGMTLLEGMSMGMPVIASAIPPHLEVGADVPRWVETGDGMAQRLREKIRLVLENRELAMALGRRGLSRAAEFSWDHSAQLMGDVYSGLLRERGKPER